ncbi:cell envelope integrity protein TolA [Bdellovibrio bacteriovorus]|uniref:Energy transducer TonB n=1 Tax=Bdellovibrio bacteriovorus TaxID=959 RepID=A0A150WCV0_BDEBC|nr:TonB family protein [Bdellovibrio bacteriovorus]KYG60692.1 energy transducer TonB [Bdellovibrio bacteriovorus]
MNYLEEEKQQDDQLSRGIGISIALHAAIISVFTLKAVFFTPEPIDFSQAVRVDMVGLPDKVEPKTLPAPAKEEAKAALPEKNQAEEKTVEKPPEKVVEKKTPPKPEPAKPVAKKEDGVNLEKVKSQQQSALEKLKAMAALDKIKNDVAEEKRKAAAGAGKSDSGAQKIKGNVLSPGTSLTGLTKLQHDTYASDLDKHIKNHWALPEWLAKRDFKAQAVVFIDSRGNILGRKIVKSSGNPSYDEAVLQTIDNSAPFPAPPEKFLAIVSVDGIMIGFPE